MYSDKYFIFSYLKRVPYTLILEVPASPCNPTPNSNSPCSSRKDGSFPGTLDEVAHIPSDASFSLILLPTNNKLSIFSPRLASAPNIYMESYNNNTR